MSGLSGLGWPARIMLGVLVAGAIGGGVFLLVRASGGEDSRAVVQLIETPTPLAPTDTPAPPTPTATALPPTATEPLPTEPPPALAPPTSPPALAPPPPKPANPTSAEGPTLAGGQWYELHECTVFYLPAGWTFTLQGGVADPGGGFVGFSEEVSGSAVFFYQDSLAEWSRTVSDPALGPAFDQIASTIQLAC